MEQIEILEKLIQEIKKLNSLSDRQFEQRFTTSKFADKWNDELFKNYQTSRIRINLLLELLTHK